jgi:protein O-mannosyl-transferase
MSKRSQKRAKHAMPAPAGKGDLGQDRQRLPRWDRRTWLVAIPLVLLAFAAFLPALDNGFVEWDDTENLLDNPYYRGVGIVQMQWAWTTFWVGVYQPLAWSLFGVEYANWELDPRGYHLTSIVLHAANTVVLYALTVTLLVRSRPDLFLKNPWTCALGAGLATALFAVHPLRVEAVAWTSSQPYLPCALFFMLAVLAYLQAYPMDSAPRRGWLVASFLLLVVALLFKAVAVTLPVVLLILDGYPLRRFGGGPGRWFGPRAQQVVLEKLPFFLVSLVFMGLAIAARQQSHLPVGRLDVAGNFAKACYAMWFYIVKTALPVDLIALYPEPSQTDGPAVLLFLSVMGMLAVSAGLFLLRRRWPGLLAAWLSYVVILAPNSGIVQINNQIAQDRYSYTAMLGLVVLAAAGLGWLWQMSLRVRPATILMATFGVATVFGLVAMTRRQCGIWHDSESLWTHALDHGAGSNRWMAHGNLALSLNREGRFESAAAHFAEAARLNPNDERVCNNFAMMLASCPEAKCRDGKKAVEAATRACELTSWKQADFVDTLAAAYAESGNFREAIKWQKRAIEILTDERNRESFHTRLALYEAGKPYRDPFRGGTPTEMRP